MDKDILKGVIDLHVHVGPSVASRKQDAYEMYKEAEKAGYRAFVVKDHYFPSIFSTSIIQKHFKKGNTEVFGSLCLNNSVGGINVAAVDVACNMGTKIIFMPTVSAKNHIDHLKGKPFVGSGNISIPEKPIYYLDKNGELIEPVIQVLEYLAEKSPDVILGTGHGTAEEIDKLIEKAFKLGLSKILVTHPVFHIGGMTMDLIKKWANMGAYIEINAVVYNEVEPAPQHLPLSLAKQVIDLVGRERVILDSDLGQKKNIAPVPGFYKFLSLLNSMYGVSEKDIEIMAKKNPAELLGIS